MFCKEFFKSICNMEKNLKTEKEEKKYTNNNSFMYLVLKCSTAKTV